MPDASFGVVLINWNGADDTIAALDSLVAASPRPERVVVIDNGSADNSVARLRDWCERAAVSWAEAEVSTIDDADAATWLLLVRASSNLGFSGGNNVGLSFLAQRTPVSHFLLLNNDAMVAADYFARMADAIAVVPDAGLLGPLIYRHPERDDIWFSGAVELPWRALVLHKVDAPATDLPYATPFVTGCAMTISRPLYEQQGGLADIFNPIYLEDTDYSHRARTAGWRLAIVPRAHVYHKVGASGGGERLTPRTAYFQNRNRAIYVRRNYRGLDRLMALGYLVITKPGRGVAEVLRGQGALGSAIVRGFLRGMTQRLA
jgi:GT2 family glycosyltransferase